jgi:hypothetical protein
MPKKKKQETPEEQSARFRAEVQRLIDAGELNPTDADAAFERAVEGVRLKDAKIISRRMVD